MVFNKKVAGLGLICVLALGGLGCGAKDSVESTQKKTIEQADQNSEKSVQEKDSFQEYVSNFKIPSEYAATLVVTINPEARLYLNEKNEILAVEFLNEDAMDAYGDMEFEGQSCDIVVEKMVQLAIDQNYLKEGKDVTVKVEEVVDDAISVTEMNEQLEASVNKVISDNDMTANVVVVVDDQMTAEEPSSSEVQEEETAKCTACNGTGNSCQECGGTAIVNCKRCNNGVESCGTCNGTAVITCHGCHGSGAVGDGSETCWYCNGSGTMSCDACGGQGTFLCSWCKGELKHICPICEGNEICVTCGGDGVI